MKKDSPLHKKPMNKFKRISNHYKKQFEAQKRNKTYHKGAEALTQIEIAKDPKRTEVMNYLLSLFKRDTTYLEIGVRNPDDNFNHIQATKKYSVDPGVEYKENPVDFQMTSDAFFEKLKQNAILSNTIKFDVIFIDGLHLADQVDTDIVNALQYLKNDGFIVLHDCNPTTQWHAREEHAYFGSPAKNFWSGTTWKAFAKWRTNPSIYSCCIDSDWGIGILTKTHNIGKSIEMANPFYEFHVLEKNRKEYLNLIDFQTLKAILEP